MEYSSDEAKCHLSFMVIRECSLADQKTLMSSICFLFARTGGKAEGFITLKDKNFTPKWIES